jgi:hypothetical protein
MRRKPLVMLLGSFVLWTACSGGSGSTPASPSAASTPAPTTTSSGTPVVSVTGFTAVIQTTSTGVTYSNSFTISETSGRSAVNMSAIQISLVSATRGRGGATWTASDGITMKIPAGGSQTYKLGVTDTVTNDLYNQSSVVITYTDDRGVAGTFTSSSVSLAPPSTTPTPTPTPSVASVAGTWKGTWSWTGIGTVNCTFHDGGTFTLTLSQSGAAVSGTAQGAGIETRFEPGCSVTSTDTGSGSFSGTVSGSTINSLSFSLSSLTFSGTASIGNNSLSGSFTRNGFGGTGAFTVSKQ